jgi:hypothetical protein
MQAARRSMVKKLADQVERLNMRVPAAWRKRIDKWREKQPFPPPSLSEAIRRLVELGLDADEKADRGKKAR